MIKYGFQWGELTVQVHSVRHDLPSAMAAFSTDFNTVAPGTDLSGLLRRSLDSMEEQEIPLAQELEFIRGYIAIEQRRFGERLRVDQNIPEDVLKALVPAFILQPLVENAIRHGIEPLESHGQIRVSARRDQDRLILSVEDNGPGLNTAASPASRRGGIGLSNTRSRLRHLYGEEGSLELLPRPGGGTEVRVTIPARPRRGTPAPHPSPTPETRVSSR